jgi:GDP-L-fucose synthase
VDDYVRALLKLAPQVDNDLVNIGAGEEHSIRSFASHICGLVGYPAERIQYDTSRYVGVTSKCLSIAKLRAILPGYLPRPLDDGLRSTIAWFFESKAYLQ